MLFGAQRRHEQDGSQPGGGFAFQFAADVESVESRNHDFQDDDVGRVDGDALQRRRSVMSDFHGVAFAAQQVRQEGRGRLLVIHDEHGGRRRRTGSKR